MTYSIPFNHDRHTGTQGNLDPGVELLTLAAKLGVAHIIIVEEPKSNHA